MDYKIFQKNVYDFLIQRRDIKKNFNFSVRQKASKGAETNYFIGTEKSGYFGFTFWDIPVSYPGSSSDLINFIFWLDKGRFCFKFQFVTAKAATGMQNEADFYFGQELFKALKSEGDIDVKGRPEQHKMYYFEIKPSGYNTFNDLIGAFENLFDTLSDIIDATIHTVKVKYPEWEAGRYSDDKFTGMQKRMVERIDRFKFRAGEGVEEEESLIVGEIVNQDVFEFKHPLNTILYGPPGTGKTYNTIEKAVKLINPKFRNKNVSRNKIAEEYDDLVSKGQIVFTTFHQSLCYEDFIEGIKPKVVDGNVVYEVTDGIFKTLCSAASNALDGTDSAKQEKIYAKFLEYLANRIEVEGKVETESITKTKVVIHNVTPDGLIFASPNVADNKEYKNYLVDKTKLLRLDASYGKMEEIKNVVDDIRSVIGGVGHTYYWAVLKEFKRYKEVQKQSTNKNDVDNYVLIIDEINRGNIAQIFGELITLIEDGKRKYQDDMIEVVLPYSKELFSVPSNLYIVGTMNTADRSVEALDTALRRRFSFEEMQPRPELLSPQRMMWQFWWEEWEVEWEDAGFIRRESDMVDLLGIGERENDLTFKKSTWEPMLKEWINEEQINNFNKWHFSGINLEKMLTAINGRLALLLDRDRTVGHAWFMKVRSLSDLKNVFVNSIIPLLQEFFYNDYGKIGLVIGEAFFEQIDPQKNVNEVFAKFNAIDRDTKKELLAKPNFKLRMPSDEELFKAFKSIYSPVVVVPVPEYEAN